MKNFAEWFLQGFAFGIGVALILALFHMSLTIR